MSSAKDQSIALLDAVRRARDIGSYLSSFPDDRSCTEPLREAALTIEITANALGHAELMELSAHLSDVANGIIRTPRGVQKLNRIIAEILKTAMSLELH